MGKGQGGSDGKGVVLLRSIERPASRTLVFPGWRIVDGDVDLAGTFDEF